MLKFGKSLYEDLTNEEGETIPQRYKSENLSTLTEDNGFPRKDMSDTPPADYIMFWSMGDGTWHAAKSLGDGEFIEIMPDQDMNNPDINIRKIRDNPYPGWNYWGAYKLPGIPLSKEELRRRVDKLREKYGILLFFEI